MHRTGIINAIAGAYILAKINLQIMQYINKGVRTHRELSHSFEKIWITAVHVFAIDGLTEPVTLKMIFVSSFDRV